MGVRNTERGRAFVRAWLFLCCDHRVVEDVASPDAEPAERVAFRVPALHENRHDQTALSLLSKAAAATGAVVIRVVSGMPILQRHLVIHGTCPHSTLPNVKSS